MLSRLLGYLAVDDLLDLLIRNRVVAQGYTDDIAKLVREKFVETVMDALQQTLT